MPQSQPVFTLKPSTLSLERVSNITLQLLDYCQRNNWAGYDPYDALNSRLFAATPFSRSRICRIALTQVLKRLPVNVRPLLLISKEQNPKALALFLMAFLKLAKVGLLPDGELVRSMIERLIALRSPGTDYWRWGYSFPWQGRNVLVPRGAANLVCTTFVADALLNAHEATGESGLLEMATSAATYILNQLYWEDGDSVGFSYPLPSVKARVHNANFLAAALFCKVYRHTGDARFVGPALKAARYSASRQNHNGSWYYGEEPTQQWIDNFHTGYNLCALQSIGQSTGSTEFEPYVRWGFEFYWTHFFEENGVPKYFHDRTCPIDIHSVAQSMITLLTLKEFHKGNEALANSVFEWAVTHMRNGNGHFFYQRLPSFVNRISYMRWSQAWMLLALSVFLEEQTNGEP